MKRYFLSVCAGLFALMVLCSVTTRAADNVYALLYKDGTLVFQYGNTPESGKTLIKTYTVYLGVIYTESSETPWYHERESIYTVNFVDKISPVSTAYWFYECKNLAYVNNIQNLDTSHVISMYAMFYRCNALRVLDVSLFNTANVMDMQWMFGHCNSLIMLDVSRFDTANVTNMSCMFYNCRGLTKLDVSRFNTSNVTDMSCMFYNCWKLTRLDMSHFDTANITDMSYMFYNCDRLTTMDISNFDTANVQNMEGMFCGCFNLKTIYVSSKFTTVLVPETDLNNSRNMFNGCMSLVGWNGTKYDSEHVDGTYARIDTASAPGYFTTHGESYSITAHAGEGGTVTPAGDIRISTGATQKYVMTPNPGYRVQSVRVDGVEVGALSEYVFQNVVTGHNLVVSFERLPRYAITAAVISGDELSVTLENSGAVTVAVWYADRNGQFLSADMQTVSANAGTVTFPLPFAYKARVTLLDSVYCPLCDPVAVR